jgi:hypothetical protein
MKRKMQEQLKVSQKVMARDGQSGSQKVFKGNICAKVEVTPNDEE